MVISAKRVVITSFLVNLSDVAIGLVLTILSGSVVVLAHLLEGIADVLASGFLILGVHRSSLSADQDHPFGHGRELYFWTLISSLVVLGITSTLSIYFGYHRLLNPEPLRNIFLTYILLSGTVITNGLTLSLSVRRLLQENSFGKNIFKTLPRSPLIETRTTLVLDSMGTLAPLLSLISLGIYGLTGDSRFDGLGAIVIGLMLGIFALFLIMSVKELLVGQSVSKEVKKNISQAVLEFKEVKKISDLKAIHTGPEQMFVNLDVNLINNLKTDEIEKLIEDIKQRIRQVEPTASQIQIELNS